MSQTKLHKDALALLIPILERFGFEFVGDQANQFRKKFGENTAQVYFSFTSDNRVYFSKMLLSIKEVEDIRLSIGLPDMNMAPFREGKNFLTTVYDGAPFSTDSAFNNPIEDRQQLLAYVATIEKYLTESGITFIGKYRHLPAILKDINGLQKNGGRWFHLLSKDGSGFFFQALIISKLCNDPAFDNKIQFVDSILYDKANGMENWLPNYARLKEVLETLQPRYQYEG